jgi:hypothetical protein
LTINWIIHQKWMVFYICNNHNKNKMKNI